MEKYMKTKMIKILALLLLLPSLVLAQGSSDCWTGGLMLGNGKYLCSYSSNGQTGVKILKVDSSGNIELAVGALESPTDFVLTVDSDAQRLFTFGASSDTAFTFTFGDGGTTANQQLNITSGTINGDDDSVICVNGGGACDIAQGARLLIYGNDNASNGAVYLQSGDDAGADINFGSADDFIFETTGGTDIVTLTEAGAMAFVGSDIRFRGVDATARSMLFTADSNASAAAYLSLYSDATNGGHAGLSSGIAAGADVQLPATDDVIIETRNGTDVWNFDTATGTFIGSGTGTIGWAVVDGTDNTACSSQCTAPAVFGFNLAGGATAPVLVGPADATADICLCAGAS